MINLLLQTVVSGTLVNAVAVLVELVQARLLHLAEEVQRACGDRFAFVDAFPRVFLLYTTEHELLKNG